MPIIYHGFEASKRAMFVESFRPYRELITFTEKEFANRDEVLRRKFDPTVHEFDDASMASIDHFLESELWENFNSKRIMMGSVFVAIFAWFEYQLLERSRQARLRIDPSSDEIHPWNYSMDSAKVDLKRLGVTPPTGSKDWDSARNLEKIRHLLVHYDGLVEYDEKDHLSRYVRDKGLMDLSELPLTDVNGSLSHDSTIQLTLTANFCDDACRILTRLLIAVSDACDAVHTKPSNSIG